MVLCCNSALFTIFYWGPSENFLLMWEKLYYSGNIYGLVQNQFRRYKEYLNHEPNWIWTTPNWFYTGGIIKFSAKESFRKILKVSHFSLALSLYEKWDKFKTSHRVSPGFSYSYRTSLVFSRSGFEISNKTLWECISHYWFCLVKILNESGWLVRLY